MFRQLLSVVINYHSIQLKQVDILLGTRYWNKPTDKPNVVLAFRNLRSGDPTIIIIMITMVVIVIIAFVVIIINVSKNIMVTNSMCGGFVGPSIW